MALQYTFAAPQTPEPLQNLLIFMQYKGEN